MQLCLALGICWVLAQVDPQKTPAADLVLFDFETDDELAGWENLVLPDAKQPEPAAKFERSGEHATQGKQSLKITFAGGRWSTLTTTKVPADWAAWQTFKADVTVSRPCLVGFSVLQEKSRRGENWDGAVSRFCKTELLRPGTTTLTGPLHYEGYSLHEKYGKVVRFEIFLYQPAEGETIFVDNIRLLAAKEPLPVVPKPTITVLGTNEKVENAQALGKKLKDRWTKPVPQSVEQIETEFRAAFAEQKKQHPQAVLAVLRDGEKGWDPANPEKPYAGWKDAFWTSHGPDGLIPERATNTGGAASQEVFMRHRSPLMRIDLSSIPAGSNILAARIVLVRAREISKDRNPEENASMWVAEPCNRPWEEREVNAYEYARGKFWRRVGGMYWDEDPDFLPLYVAHGPGGISVCSLDFREAVKFWTDGKQVNHGFMFHGDSVDYLTAHTREASEIKNRPVLFVSYVPAGR